MVELIEAYQKRFAGQMFPETLLEILKDKNPLVKVKNVRSGVIIFTNNKVLKCAGEYYESLSNITPTRTSNLYLNCCHVRRTLGTEEVGYGNCKQCHAKCIMLERSQEIKRKQRKSKRR